MIKFAEVQGWQEMQAVLKELPRALAQNALNATARAGAVKLQEIAEIYLGAAMSLPVRKGDVVIKKSRGMKGEDVQSTYLVGPTRRKPWLRWLHDGTRAHLISARTKYGTRRGRLDVAYGVKSAAGILASKAKGLFFGVEVSHPGQRSRPWLKQAQFASSARVLKAMAEKMAEAMPKQVDRLVSQKYRDQTLRKLLH